MVLRIYKEGLKAKLLLLKPHPFICQRSFIIEKLEIEETKTT